MFHYKGEYANVIERARASEVAQYIVTHKDLGVAASCVLVELHDHSLGAKKAKFWKLLGGSEASVAAPAGPASEDEVGLSSHVCLLYFGQCLIAFT